MSGPSSSKFVAAALVPGLLTLSGALAAEPTVAVTARYVSDWYYHGTTETLGGAALGVNVHWASDAWFAGLEGHQAEEDAPLQRQRSVMAYLGRSFALTDLWHGSLAVAHREFPGSVKEWDYTELQLAARHRNGFEARLDYSPDYYEHDSASLAGTVRWVRELGPRGYGYAEAGLVHLTNESQWQGHEFASVGAGMNWRSLSGDLSYRWNSEGQGNDFGQEAYSPSQFVLELAWRLR